MSDDAVQSDGTYIIFVQSLMPYFFFLIIFSYSIDFSAVIEGRNNPSPGDKSAPFFQYKMLNLH